MGTPELAVPCLDATAEWADSVRVMTQPDRPKGRSGALQPSPVKVRALELGCEVRQPERLRGNADALAWLAADRPDVVVVVAFGQILPAEVLAVPRLGCVNVHYSLLPKCRGAAPVQWALIRGETETGVTTMLMDEGLDTGPILLIQRVSIAPRENAGELLDRLSEIAPVILGQTLEELSAGRLTPRLQDHAAATLAPRLSRSDGELDWGQSALALSHRVRGVSPWPGATAEVAGETLRVWSAMPDAAEGKPGQVLAIDAEHGILIATGEGALWLESVQAPGRKRVSGVEYARGKRLTA